MPKGKKPEPQPEPKPESAAEHAAETLRMMGRYHVLRTNEEIDQQLNWAAAAEEEGKTAVRGMTYEQGVNAALQWVVGNWEDAPIEDPGEEPEDTSEPDE